jgi:hypothetical protein
MSLWRKLAKLEVLVQARAAEHPAPTVQDERRAETWQWALGMVLTNMPTDRAMAVVADLRAGQHDAPITRRALKLAAEAVPGSAGTCQHGEVCDCAGHYGRNSPLTLPEAVCRLLDEHPDAVFGVFNCARCGYKPGERSAAEMRRYREEHGAPAPRSYFTVCPVEGCGGQVGWCAWQCAHKYAMSQARRLRDERDPIWAERFGLIADT